MKYALINAENLVVNCIEWDGESPFEPDDGLILVAAEGVYVGTGFTYDGESFIAPPRPEPQPEPEPEP